MTEPVRAAPAGPAEGVAPAPVEGAATEPPARRVAVRRLLLAAAVAAWVAGALALWAIKAFQYKYWLVSAWDLGIYFNALHNLSHGDLLGHTVLVGSPIVADAAQWLLYLVAPLFAAGGPQALFALQAAALAAGALGLALAAEERWRSGLGLFVVPLVVVTYPAFVAVTLWDWHPDALAFAFLAWAVYFARRGPAWAYFTLVFLALLSKNQAVVPVAAFGLTSALFAKGTARRRGLFTLALALAVFFTNEFVVMRLLGVHDKTLTANYGYLGRNAAEILVHVLLHPWIAARAVWDHVQSWAILLAPLAFLPFGSSSSLPGFAVLVVNNLSRMALVSNPYSQYPLWALPFLVLGTVEVLGRLGPRLRALVACMLVLAAAGVFVHVTVPRQAWRLGPPQREVARGLDEAAALIEAGAPVFGQSGTVSHLYDRRVLGSEPYDTFPEVVRAAARLQPGSHVYVLFATGHSFGPIVPLVRQETDLDDVLAFAPFDVVYNSHHVQLYRSRQTAAELDERIWLWVPGMPILVDGSPLELPPGARAILWRDHTWVPLQAFAARIGRPLAVEPGGSAGAGSVVVRLGSGDDVTRTKLDAMLRSGTLYVPLRPLARALGFRVEWDATAGVAVLTTP